MEKDELQQDELREEGKEREWPDDLDGVRSGIHEKIMAFLRRDIRDVFKTEERANEAQSKRKSQEWMKKLRAIPPKEEMFYPLDQVRAICKEMAGNPHLQRREIILEMIGILEDHLVAWNPWWGRGAREQLMKLLDQISSTGYDEVAVRQIDSFARIYKKFSSMDLLN